MIRLIKSMDNLQRRNKTRSTPDQLNRRTSNTKDEDYVEEESTTNEPKEPQSVVTTSKYTLIENLCWILGAICCMYVSDIITVLVYDDRINRNLLALALSMIGVNIAIAFYLIVWLVNVKKMTTNMWEKAHPALIPIATGSFIIGSLILTVAIWPVYSWFSAPLLFIIFMGFIIVITNLPI